MSVSKIFSILLVLISFKLYVDYKKYFIESRKYIHDIL